MRKNRYIEKDRHIPILLIYYNKAQHPFATVRNIKKLNTGKAAPHHSIQAMDTTDKTVL